MKPMARRLRELPPYVFEELAAWRTEALSAGRTVFDLGVGNPDGRPAEHIVTALVESLHHEGPNPHRYAGFGGTPDLRRAVVAWYERRFQVHLDADREVVPVLGSKEGLYHLMQAYLDAEDAILIPTPCYPAYLGAARLAEAQIVEVPLQEEHAFRIRFADIDTQAAKSAKMMLFNYPHNPTGAICELDDYRDALAFCKDHDILLVSDIAYADLSLTDGHVPSSILELPGARDAAVEFSSLSKSHNMAGWRVGFCTGAEDAVRALARVKSNVDFGIFLPVQAAAVAALSGDDSAVAAQRRIYVRRRDRLCDGLKALGWNVAVPPATMYVWTKIPPAFGEDDWRFVRELFSATGVLLAPGTAFGDYGKGYVRASLVLDETGIDAVLSEIEQSGISLS